MKPQILALITAIAWGVGGFFDDGCGLVDLKE